MTGNIGSSPGGSTRIIDSTGQNTQLRDALIGLLLTAALVAVPLGVLLALRELGVGDNRLLALFPVAVGLSIALATAALVLYMKRRGIALGFHPLRGDGRHLMWEVPCIMFSHPLALASSDLYSGWTMRIQIRHSRTAWAYSSRLRPRCFSAPSSKSSSSGACSWAISTP